MSTPRSLQASPLVALLGGFTLAGAALSACSGTAGPDAPAPTTNTTTAATTTTSTSSAVTSASAAPVSASATAQPSTPASATAFASSSRGPAIPLSQNAPIATVGGAHDLPYLAFRLDSSWTQTIKDSNGIDQWKQASTKCQVTTDAENGSMASTDEAATRSLVSETVNEIRSKAPAAKVAEQPEVTISRPSARDLAFAATRVDYTGSDGSAWTVLELARGLTQDKVALIITVGCPTAAVKADPQLMTTVLSHGYVASSASGT